MKKLSLFFMITLLPVLGNAQTLIDGIYYNLNFSDKTASVTNNSNGYYSGRIVIPEKVIYGGATYSVTSIGDNAFKNCTNLTNVSISNSVTSIGNGAFGMTSLRTLIVGTGVQQFDGQAFSGATQPIKTIWLTNTPPQNYSVAQGIVNYVANSQYGSLNNRIEYKYLSSMFDVDGITYVPVSPSERTCDAIDCFYDESISFVNIDETVSYQGINMKVLSVQPYTFYQNNILHTINLKIAGGIGLHAFDGCINIKTVMLGDNITGIGEYAFSECSRLDGIIVPNSIKEIGQHAFFKCIDMTSVTIGDGTGAIGQYAFSECTQLASAIIGNGTETIGQYAFSECTQLASAIIGNGTKTIGQYAFADCSNLVSVSIGNSLRLIEPHAFTGCSSLFSIIIPGSTHYIADYAFEGCTGLQEVIVDNHTSSEETTTIEDQSFGNVVSATILTAFVSEGDELSFDCSVSFGATIYIDTPSGDYIIRNAKNETYKHTFTNPGILKLRVEGSHSAYIPTSIDIKNIKLKDSQILALGSSKTNSLFADCPLNSIYMGCIICYGLSPFYDNKSLRKVVVNSNKISTSEFYGCANLKNVLIGDNVTSIGDWAFSGCSNLKSFSFGTNVSNIGKEAFSDCTALTQLISHSTTPPTCGSQALDDINKWTCKLFVPKGCVGAYQTADQWKEFFFIEEGEKLKTEIAINEENFPDENFRAFLKEQPYGGDGILTEEEIKSIKMINVSGKNIKSLEGIEFFTTLDSLACGSNQLTSLDVSKNTALTELDCCYNQLTSLDVSKNAALTYLDCYNNQLTSLDVSGCTTLKYLNCSLNQLTSLDVSKNTALTILICIYNQLTSLDVSGCTTLKILWFYSNQLTSLDVSKNTALTELECAYNPLTSLDVSKNTALTSLLCYHNQLTSLDVSNNTALTRLSCDNNQLTSLDVSNNTALTSLSCNNNQLTSLDVSKNSVLKYLDCYDNKIRGEAMDALVGSLPNQSSAKMRVIDLSNSSEENVCTTIQVNVAKEKGWRVVTSSGEEDYEGSDQALDEDISGSCGDDVNYTYKKANHILTISGSGAIFDYDYDSNKAPWSSYADEIQKIEIESGITSIGYFAFYKCSGITSLSIPATVGYIGSSAFEDCTSLTSLSLNEGLLSIGGSAFESCIGLKTLTIPSTVNSISINAFKNCKGITDVYSYAETVPDTHFDAFDATPTEKSTLHVPANSVESYRASWPWSDFKAIVPLGSSGDANGDGVVDDKDINAIVEFIMNGKSDGFSFNNVDTNNDQKVNVADIVKIINRIKK